jgi:dihydroorotase
MKDRKETEIFDALVKNGRVIDPAQKLDDKVDIAISKGKIAKISKDIPSQQSKQVIDASGKIVTPGLIDVHCHVFDIISNFSIGPDGAGVKQGVTTVVDAGSAGEAIFPGFPKYVIPGSRTRIFCFIFMGSQGICTLPPMRDRIDLNADATAAMIEANRDIIKGIKLGLSGPVVEKDGIEVVKIAKRTAKKFGLPIMVHIGDFDKKVSTTLTQECLRLMERGDILSHVFTGQFGGVLSQDSIIFPELKDALERGVVMDVAAGGQGLPNFSFEVARKVMAQGVLPTTISSDVIKPKTTGPGFGLTAIMSIFLTLGLKLEQIIEMTTINSARAIRSEDLIGSLKPGMAADISILELVSSPWKFENSLGEKLEVSKLIVPRATIKSGQLITCLQ